MHHLTSDPISPAGPGVYDVHSPAVPPVDGLRTKIKQFVDTGVLSGHPERLWINPDCGLKTRDWVEVCSSLAPNTKRARWGRCFLQTVRCVYVIKVEVGHDLDETQICGLRCVDPTSDTG